MNTIEAEIEPQLALATTTPTEIVKAANQVANMTPQQYRAAEINEVLLPAYAKASQLELTDTEVAALTEPFPDDAVEIRPHDGLIYIPHIAISDRLNKVLRPGKWALLCRRHWLEGTTMYGEYVLLIRGCVVGESTGGHPYQPNNPKVNFSDTLESTAGEALRRICGKRLSCGSQVWNPEYARQWQSKYAVQVHGKWQRRFAESPQHKPAVTPAPVTTAPPSRTHAQPTGAASSSADSAPMVAFNEAKFRATAEVWFAKEAHTWAEEHHEPKAWSFAVVKGMILPTEQLTALTWSKLWGVDLLEDAIEDIKKGSKTESGAKRWMLTKILECKDEMAKLIAATGVGDDELRAFEAVYGKPGNDRTEPEKPKQSAQRKEPTKAGASMDAASAEDYDSPNAAWRSFPLPFGTKSGQMLGKVDKKYLFGLWANMEVETTYEKDGKQVPRAKDKIERDRQLRMHLDNAGKHYKFTLPEDRDANVERAVEEMHGAVDETEPPF